MTDQYKYLDRLYNFYNLRLFGSELPAVMITISRVNRASGIFFSNKWKDSSDKSVHEISINPTLISEWYDVEFHQTLVHEMCHLWQFEFGFPGRNGYHNKEWANKMISVGLMPSSTGKEGGQLTGQSMSDYIVEGGSFEAAFKKIQENRMEPPLEPDNSLYAKNVSKDGSVTFSPEKKSKKTGTRVKYSCECGNNFWGKSGLVVHCETCNSDFVEQVNYEY